VTDCDEWITAPVEGYDVVEAAGGRELVFFNLSTGVSGEHAGPYGLDTPTSIEEA